MQCRVVISAGSTWLDRTNYYETLPGHELELALWLESDVARPPRASRDFVQCGAAARHHLSPSQFAALETARARSTRCDPGQVAPQVLLVDHPERPGKEEGQAFAQAVAPVLPVVTVERLDVAHVHAG